MTAAGVIYLCRELGVKLVAVGEWIDATGPACAIDALADVIAAHKPGLLAFLAPAPWERSHATHSASDRQDVSDQTERAAEVAEQAGIMAFDGGMTREQAEATARQELG